MVCPHCGREHDLKQKYCPYTGKTMTLYKEEPRTDQPGFKNEYRVCTQCGKQSAIKAKFCSACGKAMEDASQESSVVYEKPAMTEKTCPECGKKSADKAKFCTGCGYSFTTSATVSHHSDVFPSTKSVQYRQAGDQKEVRRLGFHIVFLIMVILGLISMVTGAYLLLRNIGTSGFLADLRFKTSQTSTITPDIKQLVSYAQTEMAVTGNTNKTQIVNQNQTESIEPQLNTSITVDHEETESTPSAIDQESTSQNNEPSTTSASIQSLQGNILLQLTDSPNDDYTPAVSPDQRRLIYSSKIDGVWQLVEADPNSGEILHQLTSGNVNYYSPQFSSDGSMLLVAGDPDGNLNILLLDSGNGKLLKQLTRQSHSDYAPVWLPGSQDSQYLFTSRINGNDDIYLGSIDSDQMSNITHQSGFDGYPAISSDGKTMAFYSDRDEEFEIYLMDYDSGVTRRLTQIVGRDAEPEFSPDKRWIVFESNRSGNYDIYAVRTDGSDLTNLTSHSAGDYVPAFSPDGKWIFFQSDRNGNMDIYRMPFMLSGKADATSTQTTVVTEVADDVIWQACNGAYLLPLQVGDNAYIVDVPLAQYLSFAAAYIGYQYR